MAQAKKVYHIAKGVGGRNGKAIAIGEEQAVEVAKRTKGIILNSQGVGDEMAPTPAVDPAPRAPRS